MTTAIFDRLTVSGAAIFDRLVPTAGIPTITAIGSVQDGAAFTLTGTSFSASGNALFVLQGSRTVQVPVGSEGTTSITSTALDTTGLFVTQPVMVYMTNSSGVASNVVSAPIIPATGQAVLVVTQQFLGDPSSRISAEPDLVLGDELRLRNFTGVNVTGQAVPDVPISTPTFEAAAFDGDSLGTWGLQAFTLAATTLNPPDVTGFDITDAQDAITSVGLIPLIADTVPSATVAKDAVITQFPPHTATVSLGSVVSLIVSQGIVQGLVPETRGGDLPTALSLMAIAGIVLTDISYIAGGADLIITNQSLTPGQTVPIGTGMSLEISLGVAGNVKVPDLASMTEAQADYALLVAYFVPSFTGDGGNVVSQSPLANSFAAPGSTVTVVLNLAAGSGSRPHSRRQHTASKKAFPAQKPKKRR